MNDLLTDAIDRTDPNGSDPTADYRDETRDAAPDYEGYDRD